MSNRSHEDKESGCRGTVSKAVSPVRSALVLGTMLVAPSLFGLTECAPPPPVACTEEWAPVCGQDGRTYSNACFAGAAGITVLHDGECSDIACPTVYMPVCGTNDVTYGNACEAARAGQEVSHQGPCDDPQPLSCTNVLCAPDTRCEMVATVCTADCGGFDPNHPDQCIPSACNYEPQCLPIEPDPSNCESDSDCGPNERCLITSLPVFCGDEPDCGGSYGQCVAIDPPPPSECLQDSDCGPNQRCELSAVPFYCLEGDCPQPIGQCIDNNVNPSICFLDSECGPNQHCALPEIDCPDNAICARPIGTCVDNRPNACLAALCGPGTHCEEQEVYCLAVCIPIHNPDGTESCGSSCPESMAVCVPDRCDDEDGGPAPDSNDGSNGGPAPGSNGGQPSA